MHIYEEQRQQLLQRFEKHDREGTRSSLPRAVGPPKPYRSRMDRSDLEPVPAPSHPKVLRIELTKGGEKRRTAGDDNLDASADVDPKRVKMRDLVSVLRSECESARAKDNPDKFGLAVSVPSRRPQMVLKRCISVPKDPTTADTALDSAVSARILLDLASGVNVMSSTQVDDTSSNMASSSSEKLDKTVEPRKNPSPALDLDLNVADASDIMADYNPFHAYKKLGAQVKPVEASECAASTTGPSGSGSLKLWREMKQNGFLSSSHGGIPLPKKRGRQPKKRKEGELKTKTEAAWKEQQASRFARVAAPSGLLSGLNPGIINHVRNSRQVLSIIKAMVKSENLERQAARDKSGTGGEETEGVAAIGTMYDGRSGSQMAEKRISPDGCASSCFTSEHEGDALSLKLGSVGSRGSENGSGSGTSSDDISTRQEITTSLSLKGAHVASQWLQLLYQDLKGRLAALRRSKKRVRNAVQKELPRLLPEEHMSSKDTDVLAEKHHVRWKAIFSQMERSLSEEGKHLEIRMEQVNEMQLQCYRGLGCIDANDLTLNGSSNAFRHRSAAEALERESAIKASAASIYSTCSFAMSKENVPCC